MKKELLHSCPELIDYINETGFLPLLSMGINGWSAEEVVDEDCQYTRLPDGGWEWPLDAGQHNMADFTEKEKAEKTGREI